MLITRQQAQDFFGGLSHLAYALGVTKQALSKKKLADELTIPHQLAIVGWLAPGEFPEAEAELRVRLPPWNNRLQPKERVRIIGGAPSGNLAIPPSKTVKRRMAGARA